MKYLSNEEIRGVYERIGEKLKKMQKSHADFCKAIDKSEKWFDISRKRNSVPDIDFLCRAASYLGVSVSYLIEGTDEKSSSFKNITCPVSYLQEMETLIRNEVNSFLSERQLPYFTEVSLFLSCDELTPLFFKGYFFSAFLQVLKNFSGDFDSFLNRSFDFKIYLPCSVDFNRILDEKPLSLKWKKKLDIKEFEKRNKLILEMKKIIENRITEFRQEVFDLAGGKVLPNFHFSFVEVDLEDIHTLRNAFTINRVFAFFADESFFYILNGVSLNDKKLASIVEKYLSSVNQIARPELQRRKKEGMLAELRRDIETGLKENVVFEEIWEKLENHGIKKELPMKVVLYGFPGVGKSTQMKLLSQKFGLKIVSSDDIINNRIFDDSNKDFDQENSKNYDRIPREFFWKMQKKFSPTLDCYSEIRALCVEIAIKKAIGLGSLLDLGARELLNPQILFSITQNGFVPIQLRINEHEEEQTKETLFDDYMKLLLKNQFLVNEVDRENLYRFAKNEDGDIDLNSKNFRNKVKSLIFDKRYISYEKISEVVVNRKISETKEETFLKILLSLIDYYIARSYLLL